MVIPRLSTPNREEKAFGSLILFSIGRIYKWNISTATICSKYK